MTSSDHNGVVTVVLSTRDVRSTWPLRVAVVGVVGVCGALLVRLAVACLASEMSFRYVAENSRRDAPWYYRLSSVWGGSRGSLLLFVVIVGMVSLVATLRAVRRSTVAYALATVSALALVSLTVAWPFARLDVPAVRGFGLSPILEHPAMAIHPPLLYVGSAITLGAVLRALDGRAWRGSMKTAAALVAVAMGLGAVWSYLEQGWGGYWAWDPVENTSLLVWMLAVLCLHVPRRSVHPLLLAAPWLAVLFGTAFVRSGATPSVHGFSAQPGLGWALLAAASVVTVTLAFFPEVRQIRAGVGNRLPDFGSGEHVLLMGVAAAVVAVGTVAPLMAELVGGRGAAIRGVFFSRTIAPLALVGAVFVARQLRHRRGRIAHSGLLVLMVAIGLSTFDRSASVQLTDGETIRAAGMTMVGGPVTVVAGGRIDVDAVAVDITVDGHELRPLLAAYPERGGVLAETAVHTSPWRDIQVTLVDANDADQALVVVRQRPLVWLLWVGIVWMAVGTVIPQRSRSD